MEKTERDRYLAIVRSTPDRLKAALAGVPKKLLAWRPAPWKWSIHEIVCHMRDAERLGYLHRYAEILAKDNPTFPDVDGDALALERQYRRLNLREVLRDWRAARKESLAIVKKVKTDQWLRVGTHELAGPMSLEAILQRQALGNDEAHLAQIGDIKKRWEILSSLQETPKRLVALLRDEAQQFSAPDGGDDASQALLQQMAGALSGLTLDEARYALRRALAASRHLGPESISALLEEKRLLINRSGFIEYITDGASLGEVGGLEHLKKWLLERRKLFQWRDSLSADIVPKGILVMGIPGCGKSLSVKAIASCFDLPLYRIDMIEIFSGRHGKPEGAFVEACRLLEDMAPAVLWFDEIESGLSTTESGGEQGRIFAFFLTWMQEKAKGLFVAATANRIDLLPAEMIRKGRFDEVFFVDLPTESERIAIFKIHLSRRSVDAAGFDLGQLMQFTTGWAGAEIEQCVVSAVTKARLAGREVSEDDLIRTAVKIVPLSRTMSEQITHIRAWAFERAVRASTRQASQ